MFSNKSILSSPHPSNLGGNTKDYESVGGKHKCKRTHKKRKQLKKKRASRKRFLFF